MKQFLKKPLGLAVAATMAVGGMAAYTNVSAATDANALGDLALVPYYTVRDNYVTGLHITNTSDQTQVVKMRLRRGSDSADALDFNIILSPYDMWTGTINDDDGQLGISTNDKSCTAPVPNGTDSNGKPKFIAPAQFAANGAADEGYLEIIGMGQADDSQPISQGALHTAGVPADCADVRENFLRANVIANDETENNNGDTSRYTSSDNALKVSSFIRDAVTGMEMGDNATHIVNFSSEAMMSNQQFGLNSGDTAGFDFPDLDGGAANGASRGLYDAVIRADLGSASILNDWSFNAANGVSTDWVVTIPGQYLMDDPSDNGSVIVNGTGDATNHRDLPVVAALDVYDREEGTATPGGLVISPSPAAASTLFEREVNVIEWGGNKVFNGVNPVTVTPDLASGSQVGWAELSISTNTPVTELAIFDQTDTSGASYEGQVGGVLSASAQTNTTADPAATDEIDNRGIPVIGFTGWQRTFTDASKNYGRMIGHSRKSN